jgi:hypothetical protein
MTHAMKIRVSKAKLNGGLMTCRTVTIRERLLRFFLGTPTRLTIIVPGDSVDEVGISEKSVQTTTEGATHETV